MMLNVQGAMIIVGFDILQLLLEKPAGNCCYTATHK
jgi:hypothetical protein